MFKRFKAQYDNCSRIFKELLKLFVVLVLILCIFLIFNLSFIEIIEIAFGFFFAQLGIHFINSIKMAFEDKNKIETEDFPYDEKKYKFDVKIGGKRAGIWYYPCATYDENAQYEVVDDTNVNYELPSLIQSNYFELMKAHMGSNIDNNKMIRLDDYYEQDNKRVFKTSRTWFYNDLVTNRAMDFNFQERFTVRKIFENDVDLTPLKDSKMSNHIGINALVFKGDSMILAHRKNTGTLSKNKLTSSVAIGLNEKDIRDLPNHDKNLGITDLLKNAVLFKVLKHLGYDDCDDLSAFENDIKVYFLGFGRLVYTGGKPQFYYAVFVNPSLFDKLEDGKEKYTNSVDENNEYIYTDSIELMKDNSYTIIINKDGKPYKREAEKSFFANLWHLQNANIKETPQWVYDTLKD